LQIDWQVFWGVVGIIIGFILWLLTELFSARRTIKSEQARRWDQLIEWARLVESDKEPAVIRLLARQALDSAGLTETVLDRLKKEERSRTVEAFFSPRPQLSDEQNATVRAALKVPVEETTNPDIQTVVSILRRMNAHYSYEWSAEDRRLRILFVVLIFAVALLGLAAAHIWLTFHLAVVSLQTNG
jgi:hypothetical protein